MTKTAPLIDIREDHWDIVQGILQKHVPQYEVWAFGSRAKWTAKQYSDLDLAIITDKPLSLDISASLSDDFSESDLPYKVDIVDWATTSESFRKIIEQDKVVMQKGKPSSGVANEWKITTLGEFVRLQRGHDLTAEERVPGYFPVMGSAGQNGTHGKFISPGPGVVIGRSGASMGCVHYVSSDYWPHNTCLYVTDFLGNDPRFTFYFLGTLNLASYNSGSAQPSLNRNFVYTRSITVPPPIEQRAIAHILGTLDDKIELNRKQNETLEAMARALFKAWFVDFEPVRAKMEGRWQRGQSLPGLPTHLYDLFPDRLVDSELGEIPEGWKFDPLRELASTISKGTTPTKDALNIASDAATTYFLKVKDITDTGEIARDLLEFIPISIHENMLKRSILRTNDLLFSIAGTIGRVAIIDEELNNSNCNQAISFIRLKDKTNLLSLCWFTLRSKKTQDFVGSRLVQGVQANVSLATIGEIPILVPTDKILPAWNNFVSHLMQELKDNQSQSRTFSRLRDALLPKLISGELSVANIGTEAENENI